MVLIWFKYRAIMNMHNLKTVHCPLVSDCLPNSSWRSLIHTHIVLHLYSKILKRRVWRLTLYYNSPEKIRVKCIKIMYRQKERKKLDYINKKEENQSNVIILKMISILI